MKLVGKNSDGLRRYPRNRSERSEDPNDYVKPYSYLEQLLTSQRLGGDQQALVVARHSGCCQVLIGQLDVFAVILQECHDSGHQHARFALGLKMATESQTFSLKIGTGGGYLLNILHTSLTGVLSSSPSLQLSEESEGALTLSTSSVSEELTMDAAVIRPYRSKTP